jgi:hypothetical protein
VFSQGNVDFPIDSRRVVLSFLRGKCCWPSLRLVKDYGLNWWYVYSMISEFGRSNGGLMATFVRPFAYRSGYHGYLNEIAEMEPMGGSVGKRSFYAPRVRVVYN